VRVYKYRAYAPIVGADIFDAQSRARHRYQNQLIEIERAWCGLDRATKKDPEAQARRKALVKAARQDAARRGLAWGSYNGASDDVRRAVSALRGAARDEGPRFRRFDGGGRIKVQQQPGARVVVIDGDRVTFRLGHQGAVTVPVVMHRPIPPDATIKEAQLHRERVADKYKWWVTITVAVPAPPPAPPRGVVGIDLGWARRGGKSERDGRRVAVASFADGRELQVRCPESILAKIDHARGLRSLRDVKFNVAIAWLREHVCEHGAPEWLRAALRWSHAWRSQAKLAAVVLRWRDARYDGDDGIYQTLEIWRRRDKHLWTWEVHETRKALAQRREIYRVAAAYIAEHAGEVRVEDIDLAEMAESDDLPRATRRGRVDTAPSTFLAAVKNACSSRGVTYAVVSAKNTTRKCSGCGVVGRSVVGDTFACGGCGLVADRDANAARNIAASAPEAPREPKPKSADLRRAGKARHDAARAAAVKAA